MNELKKYAHELGHHAGINRRVWLTIPVMLVFTNMKKKRLDLILLNLLKLATPNDYIGTSNLNHNHFEKPKTLPRKLKVF
jgi:hypothetical protein